jgi:cyclase
LAGLDPLFVLPNHGSAARIAAGGYGAGLLTATQRYVRFLMRLREEPSLADTPLRDIIGADLALGALIWYEPYVEVHLDNVKASLAHYAANG